MIENFLLHCFSICLSMAVRKQYQNSELSPANCLLVGGFCDSLELEDLTLRAFRIEFIARAQWSSSLLLHTPPSLYNLRHLVVSLNCIKGPWSTSELCCESLYHCQGSSSIPSHESFFLPCSWGVEGSLCECCTLMHKDWDWKRITYSLKLGEIWNWDALLPFSLRSQEMRGWVCTCNHPSKSQTPIWLILLLVVALATALVQIGFIDSSATKLLCDTGFVFLVVSSLLVNH